MESKNERDCHKKGYFFTCRNEDRQIWDEREMRKLQLYNFNEHNLE